MSYHKRIILDFDDTLAFHNNRNFNDAIPNQDLINKTNALYDKGWQIDIFTARGSLSCKTREEARLKYEVDMIEWLRKNNVKYHTLSFDKPLAAYYVDDKSLTPLDFIDIDIRELSGGLSGSDIYTDGKLVHKQDKNAHLTKKWFDNSININTPNIHRIVGDTITMDYIKHDENFFNTNYYIAIGLIQDTLHKMKQIPINDDLEYQSYYERVLNHAKNSNSNYLIEIAKKIKYLPIKRSFSHGDFGIRNMLFSENKLYLIDPIANVFGSTEIDAAKFCASLILNKYNSKQIHDSVSCMCIYNGINRNDFILLMCAEIIRVFKYHPDKEFIIESLKYVYEYL